MYTRQYYQENDTLSIPENYDGTAFSESSRAEPVLSEQKADTAHNEEQKSENESEAVISKPKDTIYTSLFKKLPFQNLFGGLDFFKNGRFDFGTEEILIIGVALFMLFTKGGDKECAIMLLLLLFVK